MNSHETEALARAALLSGRSLNDPEATPFGAVVIDPHGRLLAGRAGSATRHAEIDALESAAAARSDLVGCTLVLSAHPCSACLEHASSLGITRIVYALDGEPQRELPGLELVQARPGPERHLCEVLAQRWASSVAPSLA